MKIKKGILSGFIFLTAVLMASNSLASGNNTAVQVSATVQAIISQDVIHQEGTFLITKEDVSKGYVDISVGTVLRVKTNDRRGYLLAFQVSSGLIKEVWVVEKDRTVVLSPNGGFIHQPYPGRSGETKQLGYRFFLTPETQPGQYSWPVQMTASLK